jgi:hypothetical protein
MKILLPILMCSGALVAGPAAAQSAEELKHPFAVLRDGYAKKDPAKAAEAYTADGRIVLQYPGAPREEFVGSVAIRETMAQILKPIQPDWGLDMNFKLDPVTIAGAQRTGLYRIVVTMGDRKVNSYGRFTVSFRREAGAWRFAEDVSEVATESDYENAPQPEMFAR